MLLMEVPCLHVKHQGRLEMGSVILVTTTLAVTMMEEIVAFLKPGVQIVLIHVVSDLNFLEEKTVSYN